MVARKFKGIDLMNGEGTAWNAVTDSGSSPKVAENFGVILVE